MKIYEVNYNVVDGYEAAMQKLAKTASEAGRWADDYMVTVWKDGVHSDEFFGMRACDNGWECHHYYDGKDEALWSVLKERPPEDGVVKMRSIL